MKKIIIAALVAGSLVASCANNGKKREIKTSADSLSYAVGLNLSKMVSTQLSDIPLDYVVLEEAFCKAVEGNSLVSTEDAQATLQDYFMNKRQARAAMVAQKRAEADSIAIAGGATQEEVAAKYVDIPADEAMFENDEERTKISRAMGSDLGNSVLMSKIPVDVEIAVLAFEDVKTKAEPKMTEEQANGMIQNYFMVEMPKQNAEASAKWLADIEAEGNVQKTESGIVYRIEVAGDDAVKAVNNKDVVKVKYTGKTRDGKVFDSSRFEDMDPRKLEYMKSQSKDGELSADAEIIEFTLEQVIPGWTEGMKLVGKGGRISLWIPSELAYGQRGGQGAIGPNEALYFDVEVVDVEFAPAEETK